MAIDIKRENIYRNNYYKYWYNRVEESNKMEKVKSEVLSGDFTVPSDSIYRNFFEEHLAREGKVLDIGCGWGRFFKYYRNYGMQVYGIDISNIMVNKAKELYNEIAVNVQKAEAEELPFNENYFDVICCFGVFDATYQDKTISEMLRVAKLNGKIIFTGKNSKYLMNDIYALQAEQGAMKNNEPNYFTDVSILLKELMGNGHIILNQYYFQNRGDMSANVYVKDYLEEFYEYCLVIKKCTSAYSFSKFYKSTSTVFSQIRTQCND